MSQFDEVTNPPSGKKASQVADLLKALVEAKGKPRSYEEMCKELGIKYPGDLQPAMHSLEFVGAVARFTCMEEGSKRKKVAYAITKAGTRLASAAIKDQSKRPRKS